MTYNRQIRVLLLLVAMLVIKTHAKGQPGSQPGSSESVPATLEKDLDQYYAHRLQEKIFVHTDKEFYLAGEICWFKLYNVDATLHKPLDLSKVAYLEWLDKNNRPVLQAKIGLHQGRGNGSVYLPLTLISGNYKLRAYTSWMKNYGADWFFEKSITVVNARKSAEVPAAETPLQYSIAFFPEGGNMVENIPGRIAFRATDQYGRGVECTGVVTEDDADTVVRFHPLRFGIGNFVLTPRPGHRYRSTIRLADGTAISNLLPVAYKEGIAMRVSSDGSDRIRVDVRSTLSSGQGTVYLLAHTRQLVKLAEAAPLQDGKCSFVLDKKSLGDGISHITIFNGRREPVCERLFYKAPSRHLEIAMKTDKDSYATRKKVSLRVSSTGPGKDLSGADCSISVFRVDSLQGMSTGHIESYLWLASDLSGRIESPDYYFDHPEDQEAMDNLMMTHGWRRFHWGDVLQHASPSFEFAPEYKGEIVTGKMVDTRAGTVAKDVQGYLSVPGTRTQFSSAISDGEGRLTFEMPDFYGGQEIVVQTNPGDSIYRIDIANPFSENYTNFVLPPFAPPLKYPQILTDKSVAMQVLNRYGGEKLKKFNFPAGVDTSVFYYSPDFSYLLDDYVRFTTMEEVMREYVRLMLVKKKGEHFHLPLYDLPNSRFFDADPLLLLDGVPVFNIDSLMTLDPLKMRKLDVLTRKYFLGGTNFDGIMNWITYKGDLGGYILDPHATVIDYEGLQLQREFYAPSYGTEEEADTHLPDFRNVLYWSPDLPIDAQGAGALDFYSSDLPGEYIAVLEGIASDGTAGSSYVRFEVK